MNDDSLGELNTVFDYYAPQNKYIGILSIPHSGEFIPDEFTEHLTSDVTAIGQDVDFKVDELVDIQNLNENGIAVIIARIHRTCVDLNRAKEICILNWKKNSHGVPLVLSEPDDEKIQLLTQKYYAPYYEMLKALIFELYQHQKNEISFIDLHSMPSTPTKYHLDINPNQSMQRPHFCVSDINGLSCHQDFIDYCVEQIKQFDSNTSINDPYLGGNITRYINKAYDRINNIQIEINRSLYMDENKKILKPGLVKDLKTNLTKALIDTFLKFRS